METARTLHAVIFQLGFVLVGVAVVVAALLLPANVAGYSGLLYSLNGVVGFVFGSILGKRERAALEKVEKQAAVSANI